MLQLFFVPHILILDEFNIKVKFQRELGVFEHINKLTIIVRFFTTFIDVSGSRINGRTHKIL